jgi:hypothetical protein
MRAMAFLKELALTKKKNVTQKADQRNAKGYGPLDLGSCFRLPFLLF